MKLNKSQVISWLITIGATFSTVYGFIQGNMGILTEFGIDQKWAQLIMLIGLIATALSSSLAKDTKPVEVNSILGSSSVPTSKDEK